MVFAAQFPLQQVEGQATGHGQVALAAHTGTGGDGLADGQAQVGLAELQRRSPGGLRQRLVVGCVDAVVAAGCHGQLAATGGAGQLQQPHVEVAAGMQGYGCLPGVELLRGVRGQGVLLAVLGIDP
ncbi:hypothetical protein FQZ97_900370 [compost metagenome]